MTLAMIDVVDPITGVVETVEVDSPQKVRNAYEIAKNMESIAKQIREDLKPYCEEVVKEYGDGKAYLYKDGKKLVHISGQKMKVDPVKAWDLINDPDMFVEMVSISKTKFEDLITEWVAEGKLGKDVHPKDALVAAGANDHFTLVKT